MSIRRRAQSPQSLEPTALRERLQGTRVSVGIPSFNEGPGIVHTLASVHDSWSSLGLTGLTIILSDSSETTATVDAARAYADVRDIELVVDRNERRRSSKEARNVIMSRASSELLVQVDADVIVTPRSLYHLLRCLIDRPQPAVVVGVAAPDPRFAALAYKASAWQLKATRRNAASLPDDAVRAEASCWGAWHSFYSEYRFPVGADSPADDVSLARYVLARDIAVRNCWRAVVYKVPAATLNDFFLQTHRGYAASEAKGRTLKELAAAAVEGAKDPVGAAMYARARVWSARERRRRNETWQEEWEISRSTKRS